MVDDNGRRRRLTDHGHPISSPCEPLGSGELINVSFDKLFSYLNVSMQRYMAI